VPTVTYTGKWYSRTNSDITMPDWLRGREMEVTQDWLNNWRPAVTGDDFRVEGDDAGDDGLPDANWNRPEIVEWLSNNGIDLGIGYKTKSTLLSMVEGVLSPAPVEEPVVETPVVEPVAEEVNSTIEEE